MAELKLRVAGYLAPIGSPERDYFEASIRGAFSADYPQSGEFKAATHRLMAEGCPIFTAKDKVEWDGSKWLINGKETGGRNPPL